MNKNTLGPLAVALVGVAAFGAVLAFSEQPTACPCNSSSNPNPWYPCIHNPCPKETLVMQSYRINTPTNLTLNISNVGASPKALIAYYVKDSTSAQYANSGWSGPTIPPAIAISVNILIDGRAFTFRTGMSYTVTMVTSTYDQFTFTIT
jgi:hypothetical protein